MAYRRLLLPLLGTDAGRAALATAFVAARIWRAHVHALHVRVDPRDVAPLAGEGLSGAMIEEMMAVTEKEAAERAKGADAQFRVWLAENGIADTSDPQAAFTAAAVTADCAVVTGREEDVLAQEARLAEFGPVAAAADKIAARLAAARSGATPAEIAEDSSRRKMDELWLLLDQCGDDNELRLKTLREISNASRDLLTRERGELAAARADLDRRRTELAETEAARKAELAAELAAKDAEIEKLQAELAAMIARFEAAGQAKGFTPELIAQIKGIYGIKPA
jgi:uncharacterized coiled-coil protein SlyX